MALTKYKEGSLRELWTISVPLMLSSFSIMCMLFVDRLFLAHYSTEALNAAVNATTLGWCIAYAAMILTTIAEVFVAQLNGAGQKDKLGEPVWQMIWLSIGSTLFFIPLAIWGSAWIYGDSPYTEMERVYFQWMMVFAPTSLMYGALSSFFIGQGKMRIITVVAFATNIINAVLDYVLIFGMEGAVEPMGIKGAAIATSGSYVFQVLILAWVFLNKENRQIHNTQKWAIQYKLFWNCLRIGLPNALFIGIELSGWAVFYWMMTFVGPKYITLAGICQSVAFLFYFFSEGVSKGAAMITGNLIGSGRSFLVTKVLKSGIKLHVFFCIFLFALFSLYSDFFISQFLNVSENVQDHPYYDSLKTCLLLVVSYLFFEGIRFLFSGLLTAAGDTFFLLVVGSTSVWFLLVMPIYLLVVKGGAQVETAVLTYVVYSFIASMIYLWRFQVGKWKDISITA